MTNMRHMDYLEAVASEDVKELQRKEATYKGSWKRRGGIGAYMMVARKFDRLEGITEHTFNYDIFRAIEEDMSGRDGSVLAEVRDLRRYLLLIEAEMCARENLYPIGVKPSHKPQSEPTQPGTPENGGHHARQAERLSDGIKEADIAPGHQPYYMTAIGNGKGFVIVDRRKTPVELWEHLPRLFVELNNKEHEELDPAYKGLYQWLESDTKWRMREQYRDCWARQ
jgi:hypothetical protein